MVQGTDYVVIPGTPMVLHAPTPELVILRRPLITLGAVHEMDDVVDLSISHIPEQRGLRTAAELLRQLITQVVRRSRCIRLRSQCWRGCDSNIGFLFGASTPQLSCAVARPARSKGRFERPECRDEAGYRPPTGVACWRPSRRPNSLRRGAECAL